MRKLRPIARPFVPGALEQPEVALAQDGVFTRAQARAAGWSDSSQRRLLRMGIWVPVTRSVLRHGAVEVGPWQRARAVALTGGRVVSHATAGALYGLAVPEDLHGIRRSGRRLETGAGGPGAVGPGHGPSRAVPPVINDHRMALGSVDVVPIAGMEVTTPRRTLVDLLCGLSLEWSVAMVTDAFRRDLIDVPTLRSLLPDIRRRTGAGQAREVIQTCDGRPFSVLEWRFQRLVSGVAGEWRFNHEIADAGGVIGVVDSVHVPSRTVIELDGRAFHGPDRFQADRSRDQRLLAAGYVVLRFTWEDIERRPLEVLRIIRRTISARMPGAA